MKIKIKWNCVYSDGESTWDEKRFRVLNIDPDHAVDAITNEYKQKYQCEPIKTNDGLQFADELDCVLINNFSIERLDE